MSRSSHALSVYLAASIIRNKRRRARYTVYPEMKPDFYKPFSHGRFVKNGYFTTEDDWRRYKENPSKYLNEWNEKWEREHTPAKPDTLVILLSIASIVISCALISEFG